MNVLRITAMGLALSVFAMPAATAQDEPAQVKPSQREAQDRAPNELEPGFEPLFDGETLGGWEGSETYFRVEDGCIVAGMLSSEIPHNEFLATEKQFGDFELRLQAKVRGEGANSGVQFRSRRVPGSHEVAGYQCDIGRSGDRSIWGSLYDESRRRRFLAHGDAAQVENKVDPEGWNEMVIRCEGPRIQLFVNGLKTVDYVEADSEMARRGILAVQIHSGPPSEAWFKDIRIKRL